MGKTRHIPTEDEKRRLSSRMRLNNPMKDPLVIEKMRLSKKGKKLSREHRIALKGRVPWNKGMRGFLSAENSPHWKGGATPKNKAIRMSTEYRLWRESVFKRDKYTCVWCGSMGYIEADHIKPFALYPELRFAIDNGRTLCLPCHKTTDTYKSKSRGIIK